MGDCARGIVGGDYVFFGLGIGIFTDKGLDVIVGDIFEVCGVTAERSEVVEEKESCRRVFKGAREECAIGAEEGDTVERGA